MDCDEPWFSHIFAGRKPVEGRKASPAWASIRPDDTVVFRRKTDGASFRARVTEVVRYASPGALRQYLETETLARALPGVATLEEGEAVYLQWSTAEEITQYGMLGIQVQVESAKLAYPEV